MDNLPSSSGVEMHINSSNPPQPSIPQREVTVVETENHTSEGEDDDEQLYQQHQKELEKIADSLFDVGKDLHGTTVNHQYTQGERAILNSYDSQDYFPPHSRVYLDWLSSQPTDREWDRWIVMGLIGFITGLTGFFLHQLIDLIANTKWNYAKHLLNSRAWSTAWPGSGSPATVSSFSQ